MRGSIVDYGDYACRLVVLKPDAEYEVAVPVYTVNAFLREFYAIADTVHMAHQTPTSESAGIAAHLLQRYGRETLLEYARHFWLRHSEPLVDKPSLSAVKLFASRIDLIKAQTGS